VSAIDKVIAHKGRLLIVIMAVCLSILSIGASPSQASATAAIDVDKSCSMTLDCSYDGSALSGMMFKIYRVADVSETAFFTLSGDFSSYKVNINNLDSSGWNTAANTLANYVGFDNISALMTKTTDSKGHIDFGTVSTGLYLIVGQKITTGNTTYTVAPFLVSLPNLSSTGAWNYSVGVIPKLSATTIDNNLVDISVVKVWNDDGGASARPNSIDVVLLRDGAPYDTYTLTATNYWRHTWSNLSDRYTWTVIEKNVPNNYTVTYSSNHTTLTITNTSVDVPKTPSSSPTLPQTGMLWWPVPVMAVAGVLLFSIGWRRHFRHYDEKSKK
jgi:hypothetical protein